MRATDGGPGRIPRRTFLELSGLTVAGLLAAPAVRAAMREGGAAGTVGATDAPAREVLAEVAAALDYDPARIFRFVADEIAYEPYAGVLRGARGTLEGRAGNAADKSLLLAALLGAALVPVRFVIGTLDESGTDALRAGWAAELTAIQARAVAVMQQPVPVPVGSSAPVATPAPSIAPLPPDARAFAEARAVELEARATRISALLDAGMATIGDALGSAGVAVPDAPDPLPALERDRHVWVQVLNGPDWMDMDASVAGSEPGMALGTPVELELAALPDDLRHRVELRVTVERIAGETLEQEVILEVTRFADELSGLPMALVHETPEGLAGVGVSIGNSLGGLRQYQPVLQVGDTATVGTVGVAFPDGSGDGGALGALGSGERDGEATAEWLETVTTMPDGTRSVARRVLFDRLDAPARAAGSVLVTELPAPELVALEPGGSLEFPAMRAMHFLAVAGGATSTRLIDDLSPDDGSSWPLHLAGHLYHLARDGANAAVAAAHGARLFHDRPNIVRFSVEPAAGPEGGLPVVALDILHRGFGALPVVGRPVPAHAGVLAGVLSHVMERVVLEAGADPAAGALDVSVGALLEAAAAQGIEVRLIGPGEGTAGLAYPTGAQAMLDAALAEGLLAIGPMGPVLLGGRERVGWWLLDPVTGAVTDRMDDGRGVAMTDYLMNAARSWLSRHPYIKLGLCIAALIKTLAGMLQAMGGGSPLLFVGGLLGAVSPINGLLCG